MSEHIVGEKDVGPNFACLQLLRGLNSEKTDTGVDSLLDCSASRSEGGIETKDVGACLLRNGEACIRRCCLP